jgi:hypothetical protein
LDSTANLPEVFANWQVAPSYPSVEVAFDLGASGEGEASLWQIDLPADPEAAAAQLERSAAQVSATQAALEGIPARIEALVSQRQALGSDPVAFDMAGAVTLAEPESELLRWLDSVDPGQPVSFGMESVTSSEVKGAGAQFLQGTDQLLRLLVHFAWVETQVEGDLLARTVVDWTGDSNTAWGEELSPQQFSTSARSRLRWLPVPPCCVFLLSSPRARSRSPRWLPHLAPPCWPYRQPGSSSTRCWPKSKIIRKSPTYQRSKNYGK